MLIAGVNLGFTLSGRPLKDGGACLLQDGKIIVAIAEERLTRKKHDGGFSNSLRYCLDSIGASESDLDLLVYSSCCEPPREGNSDTGLALPSSKIRSIPSHHLSHAFAAYMPSPFDSAVVMVLDNEGNFLGQTEDPVYWNNRVERQSYYIGNGDKLIPLQNLDDNLGAKELGVGEVYRHFTYFLGWPSYVFAGKTMGLAPYGNRQNLSNLLVFDLRDGEIHSLLENGCDEPERSVLELASRSGVDIGRARMATEAISDLHTDVAAVAQAELERALIYKAQRLHELTGELNLCIGGGVALNCVANSKILSETGFENLYVSPAPGDSGQCIGNAFYGWNELNRRARCDRFVTPFLGREYSESEMLLAIEMFGDKLYYSKSDQVCEAAAQLLSESNVIGWFQGGSELGPRALGCRSILADPRQPKMRDYINSSIKSRELFRPFAPSVLESEFSLCFEGVQHSPYMEIASTVRTEMKERIPAVVHIDGSSRAQTVSEKDNKKYYNLIEAFFGKTGIPLVLNTSFNLGGEPIVETPTDALNTFMNSELDALVLGDFVVRKAGRVEGPGFGRLL